MAQYIDKDQVIEWIKQRLLPTVTNGNYDDWEKGADNERINFLSFINSLPEYNIVHDSSEISMTDKVQLIKQEIEKRMNNLWYLIPEGEKVLKDDFTKDDANNLGKYTALESLLQFIDSLPEEPTDETMKKNYHERYKKIAQTEQFKKSYCDKSLGREEPASEDLEKASIEYSCANPSERSNGMYDQTDIEWAFEAGAEWQKQQMKEVLQTEYEKGRFDMRKEMMKDAVDAFVNTYENTDDSNYVEFATEQSPYKFKETEKCKLIIVKED